MTTITNNKGTKAVNITTTSTGTVMAMYVQIYNNEEQVLQSKSFQNANTAQKWATKILN